MIRQCVNRELKTCIIFSDITKTTDFLKIKLKAIENRCYIYIDYILLRYLVFYRECLFSG